MTKLRFRTWATSLRRVSAMLGLALLASCGGELALLLAAPGVGTGGTGIIAGVLTGLGSVVVDGQRYDESQATLEQRPDLGTSESLTVSALQIGQAVELQFDVSGNLSQVRVEAQLVGPATQINAPQGRFTVWGQNVRVNTLATAGPVTVFSGYGSLADLSDQDAVRVYGVLGVPEPSGTEVILASRIERISRDDQTVARLTASLQGSANSGWQLGGLALNLAQATLVPQGWTPTEGQLVTAVGPWMTTGQREWSPSALRAPQQSSALQKRVAGPVRLLGGAQLGVSGLKVDASASSLAATVAALKSGDYIVLQIQRANESAPWVASSVEPLPPAGRTAELKGNIESVVSEGQFTVRGMTVDASQAIVSGGTRADLKSGRFVDIVGEQQGNQIVARQLSLLSAPPDRAVLDLQGQVQSVDLATGLVQVRIGTGQVVPVGLPAGAPRPNTGDQIRVEGYWTNGQLNSLQWNSRPAPDATLVQIEGVIEGLDLDGLRILRQKVLATPDQLQALRAVRDRRVLLRMQASPVGTYHLVSFEILPRQR
jgi:hypothetical protein